MRAETEETATDGMETAGIRAAETEETAIAGADETETGMAEEIGRADAVFSRDVSRASPLARQHEGRGKLGDSSRMSG